MIVRTVLVLVVALVLLYRNKPLDKIDYYVKLITDENFRATLNEIAQDSTDFVPDSEEVKEYGTFDYIIIGAGSAGAVIANRLTEIPENRVLLLEAGGLENDYSDIPSTFLYLQGLEFNWNYTSIPQSTSCLGMLNRECPYPRGKGLGGTSIINAVMYVRGNKLDYDRWANDGNVGWSYEDVLPYFIKSENSSINGDEGYHGIDGYLNVEYQKNSSIQFQTFIEAHRELNRRELDYNGREQIGVGQTQINTIDGQRSSTGRAFLRPIMDRKNLVILTHSLATKIIINSQTKRAHGVQFSKDRQLQVAYSQKEVILSAGAINSPQLLMLSGIGPSKHLADLDIETIQDLQVGENLHDHPAYFSLLFSTNHTESRKDLKEMVEEYLQGYGCLTIGGNSQGLAFLQTGGAGSPDVEQIIIPSFNMIDYLKESFRYRDDLYEDTYNMVDPSRSFSIYVMLLHPKSRGSVKLKSNSPYDYPLIDPRFLSDPDGDDIETLYQGIKLALKLKDTKAFRTLNTSLIYNPLRVCKHHDYLSREFWYCQLRQLGFHIFHTAGTCKMGTDPVKGAVVDPELRVHGVEGLRVADASIIPTTVAGHVNAIAIMIGEKVSDLIKATDYKHR